MQHHHHHRATTIVALLLQFTCFYIDWVDARCWESAYTSLPCRRHSQFPAHLSRISSTPRVSLTPHSSRALEAVSSSFAKSSNIRSNSYRGLELHAAAKYNNGEDDFDASSLPSKSSSSSLDPLVVETSMSLRRISWLSWWAQVILTTVSSVTLIFARNVVVARRSVAAVSSSSVFWLAGWGLLASLTSIVWTWGGARLSRRLLRKTTSRMTAAHMTRRAIRIGVLINLVGMGLTLLGAEQIVGGLAIKVLTQQPQFGQAAGVLVQTVEPLDILVVQANTNTLFSHFCSLASLLYLTKWIPLLDPPSLEKKEQTR